MNSIASCEAGSSKGSPAELFHSRAAAEQQLKRPWKSEGGAYALALLVHFAAWQAFRAMPLPQPEEPTIIEATLVLAPPAKAAAAPTPPPPQPVQQAPKPQPKPPPKPKPLPKQEKPVVKKPDRPKPVPIPQAEAESVPPLEETPAPVSASKAAPKADAEPAENTRLTGGSVSGFDRHSMPRIAREQGWEGTVTLKFKILASGEVAGIQVIGSSGHEVLDDHAVEMLRSAHVAPCRRGDTPVDCPTSKILPIHFRLER